MILSSPDLLGRLAEISQGFKQALPAQGAHGLPEPLVGGPSIGSSQPSARGPSQLVSSAFIRSRQRCERTKKPPLSGNRRREVFRLSLLHAHLPSAMRRGGRVTKLPQSWPTYCARDGRLSREQCRIGQSSQSAASKGLFTDID